MKFESADLEKRNKNVCGVFLKRGLPSSTSTMCRSGEKAPLLEKRRPRGGAAAAALVSAALLCAAWSSGGLSNVGVARIMVGRSGAAAGTKLAAAETIAIARVFYINCDGDEGRRASLEAQLDAHLPDTPRERVACVSSSAWTRDTLPVDASDADLLDAFTTDDLDFAYVSLAIYLSHQKVLRKIASLPEDGRYLLLEDDALFADNFAARLEAAAPWPRTFDVIRLGCWQNEVAADRQPGGGLFVARAPDDHEHQIGTIYMGGHAALWSPKGARAMLENLASKPFGHVDSLLRTEDVEAFASYCVACARTLVSTDESLPSDHNAGDTVIAAHVDDRACIPSD